MRRQIALALGGCLAAAAVGVAQQGTAPVVLPVATPQYTSPFAVTAAQYQHPPAPAMLPPASVVAQPTTTQYVPVQPIQTYTVPAGQPMAAPAAPSVMAQPVMAASEMVPAPAQAMTVQQPIVVAPQQVPTAPAQAAPVSSNTVQYIAVQPVPAAPKAPAKPADPAVPTTPAQPVAPAAPVGQPTAAATVPPTAAAIAAAGCAPSMPCGATGCDPCQTPCCQVCGPAGRFWVNAEYLLWWTKGNNLPPIVTSSPAGTPRDQAGVLGAPGTVVLFGGDVNDELRSGFRLRAGFWLDCCQTSGFEGSYFFLGDSSDGFDKTNAGSGVISRPFVNAVTGAQDAQLVCFPELLNGGLVVNSESSFTGFDLNYRRNLCCDCCYRADWLLGFRYLRLDDELSVAEDLTVIGQNPNGSALPIGTRIAVNDFFQTRNEFWGPQIGLAGERRFGAAFVSWRGLIAFGTTHKEVTINGNTTITQPGGAAQTYQGGLYALPTNIGRYVKNDFAVVPEIGLNAGFQVSCNVRVYVGYSLLYWSNVTRPGDVIDLVVNPTQLPPGTLNGPARPAFGWRDSDFWAQGVNFGAELRY